MATSTITHRQKWMLFVACGYAAALTGCSAERPPIEDISTADMAMNRALDANAAQLAPLDLRIAREKMDLAKANMSKEDYVHARRQAQEARVDARVAEARSKALTAGASNREVRQTIDNVRHDIEQNATDR